jgi:hypothetical protein
VIALVVLGAATALGVLTTAAFFLGRSQAREDEAPGYVSATPGVGPTSPAPPPAAAPVATRGADVPANAPTGAPPSPDDERVLTASQHGSAYGHPLLFHYAHVGGMGIADVHGQLDHRDGHYFQLGPGDSLTLEAPEGFEFVSDGSDTVMDLEIEVHPHDHASHRYEIDVSHAHLDVNGPWVVLGHGEAHEWDLDHANVRSARYVRIRNLSGSDSLYIDGVYVRQMQRCTNPARCRDVNHLIPQR